MLLLIVAVFAFIASLIMIFGSEVSGWGVALLLLTVVGLFFLISAWCGPQPVSWVVDYKLLPLMGEKNYVIQWPVQDSLSISDLDELYGNMMLLFIIDDGGTQLHEMIPDKGVRKETLKFGEEPHLRIEKLSGAVRTVWGNPGWHDRNVLCLPPGHRDLRIGE